jgi:4-hydroxy-tetrahydrodipicolinate synthase
MVYSFAAGDAKKAAELHRRLLPAFKAMFITTNPIPVKAALSLVGINAGPVRPPLVDLTGPEMEKVKAGMRAAGIL